MKKTNFAKLLVASLFCSMTFAGVASAARNDDSHLTNECVSVQAEALLSQADLAAIDAIIELDSLGGSSQFAASESGTCEKPILTGACLTCADKASCTSCCINKWGQAGSDPDKKKNSGCLSACGRKFTGSTSCVPEY